MSDKPGRQQLSGYVMRDYDHAITTLGQALDNRGLSQRELARHTRLHQPQISMWLLGKSQPLAGNLFALADALGYDLALIPREDA